MLSRGLRLSSSFLVILGMIIFILKYYAYVLARAEQRVIDLEIGAIKRLYKAKIYIPARQSLQPIDWQEKKVKSLFQVLIPNQTILVTADLNELPKGSWGFLTTTNQLIYHVKEPAFFKSVDAQPYIYFSLVDKKLKVSTFQWCKHRNIWGCRQW